jgi:hypothetical protein
MRTLLVRFVLLLTALSLGSSLPAQSTPPARPSVGDLREEQRKIDNAYLGDAEFQIKRARERLGTGSNRLAQQSGLWALEQLAYAKRRLESHAPKIEEAGGIFGRAIESTRKDLRESYAKIRENYVNIEERLDVLAEALKKAGLPILAETLNQVRSESGDGAVRAAQAGLRAAGERAQGDKLGGSDGGSAPDAGAGSAMSSGGGTGGGSHAMQNGSNVTVPVAGGNPVSLPGTLSADGRYIDSPEFGRIDVSSVRTLADGTVVAKSDRGVVYLGKDGKWHLLRGAQIDDNGNVTTASGETGPLSKFINASSGMMGGSASAPSGPDPRKFTGDTGDRTVIDAKTGKRIRVGPKWENGEQKAVATEYGDEEGGVLLSETQITRKLVEASGAEWKAVESPGQNRSWDLNLKKGEEKSANGSVSFTLGVTSSGSGGFQIESWQIVNERGDRAAVSPASGNEVTATFTKEGRYSIAANGKTDWGTPFRVKGETTVNP